MISRSSATVVRAGGLCELPCAPFSTVLARFWYGFGGFFFFTAAREFIEDRLEASKLWSSLHPLGLAPSSQAASLKYSYGCGSSAHAYTVQHQQSSHVPHDSGHRHDPAAVICFTHEVVMCTDPRRSVQARQYPCEERERERERDVGDGKGTGREQSEGSWAGEALLTRR